MQRLKIKLLGYFKVELDGKDITQDFRTEKERALFAYIVKESTRPINRDFLAEMLWPERSTQKSRTNMRQALYGIRKVINDQDADRPFILLLDDSIQFNWNADYYLDTEEITGLLQSFQTHSHEDLNKCETCLEKLQRGIDLYQGHFFEDMYQIDSLDYMEWLYSNRERYFRFVLTALHNVSQMFESQGNLDRALQFTEQLVALEPLDENSHRQLMELLFKSGQRSAALEQFLSCKDILEKELNVAPSEETQELYRRIKEGTIPIRREERMRECRVPADMTSFLGREVELERLSHCVQNPVCRLLSFVGLPGIGKTRLATQTALRYQSAFPDGVLFFPLENDDRDLLTILSRCMLNEFKPLDNPRAQLLSHLSHKKKLLIIDHFEPSRHELDILIDILHIAPDIKIIVTSQERLHYQAACLFEIRGLKYPRNADHRRADQFTAVQLFHARAYQNRSYFSLTEKNLPHVIRLCQLVEGNPLAIELAAANVGHFSIQQIADALEDSICILATLSKDVPLRHRKMRTAVEVFWDKLTEVEKRSAIEVSSYDSNFRLEDAQIISGLSADDLSALVDRSVLYRDSQGLFHMPNLLKTHIVENGFDARDLVVGVDGDETKIDPSDDHTGISHGISESGLFWDRLKHLIYRSHRNRSNFGVVSLDVFSGEDAEGINPEDRDTAIALTAEFLKTSLRKSDTIARLKPNEFTLLLEDLKSKEDLEKVMEKIREALTQPVDTGDYRIIMPFRMGSSYFPDDGEDGVILIRMARQKRDKVPSSKLDFYMYSGNVLD